MNLIELYEKRPGNYFICSDLSENQFLGGRGKTSQMQYLAHALCEKGITPIYIAMNRLNTQVIDTEVLYKYIYVHFHNAITKKAVLEMIREFQDYQYVFLLDGVNEVNNYMLASGQTVYDCLVNNIKELICYRNVHFVITSRMEHEIIQDEELSKCFEKKYICTLEREQYKEYLQMEIEEIVTESLQRMFENAMLLRMFKCVYEVDKKNALSFKTRYDLMKRYFEIETEYKKISGWNDLHSRSRDYLISDFFPYIGFQVRANRYMKLDRNTLLKESKKMYELPRDVTPDFLEKVIQMTGLLDEELNFQHELIRDYFAVEGFLKRWEYPGARSSVAGFMEELHEDMKYNRNKGMEYNRRTYSMDFCELLYACIKDKLQKVLKRSNMKEESVEAAFLFYYDLAGLYKDLIQTDLAEEFGEIAIRLLGEMEKGERYSDLQLADCYTYLGYCLVSKSDSIQYLQRAKSILERYEDLSKKEKRLMGRILSNMGAYYYAREDFESALLWHQHAMEYRVEKELLEDIPHSFRTLMSDYFKLRKYEKAYECYLKGLEFLEDGVIDLEFEERAMGSEIALLGFSDLTEEKRAELLQRLTKQIELVFEGATSSYRKNMNLLENLCGKLNQLEGHLLQNQDSNVYDIIWEYREKCESILKG